MQSDTLFSFFLAKILHVVKFDYLENLEQILS